MSSLTSKPVFRWGLIGPGRIAGQFARALNAIENSCLQAVAGRNRRRTEKFAREHGVATCYEDYRELLDDPLIDAIYIAAPHRFHHELTRDCLLAGKPTLCEKPLTVNAREAGELIELSRNSGVFLMEALWTRFLPIYEDVSQWLVAGKIGEVTSISSSFGFKFPRDTSDRLLNHDLAGGVLLDMGVYNLSMSQWVFGGQPVKHTVDAFIGDTGVDEYSDTILEYPDGRCSRFSNSMVRQLSNDLIIHGSGGHIQIHPMFWSATRATLVAGGNNKGVSVSSVREFRATGMEYEIEAAQQCIRRGLTECPTISHDNTLETMQLMDALRRDMGLSYRFE